MDLVSVVPSSTSTTSAGPSAPRPRSSRRQVRFRAEGAHGRGRGFDREFRLHRFRRPRASQRASPGVRVNSYCEVEYSILMPGVEIGRYSGFAAIINTGVNLPDSSVVGFDLEADRAKGYHVTEAGIVVVA